MQGGGRLESVWGIQVDRVSWDLYYSVGLQLGFEVLGEEGGCWHLACGERKFPLLPIASNAYKPPKHYAEPHFSVDLLVRDLQATKKLLGSEGEDLVTEVPPNEGRFFIRDPDG